MPERISKTPGLTESPEAAVELDYESLERGAAEELLETTSEYMEEAAWTYCG